MSTIRLPLLHCISSPGLTESLRLSSRSVTRGELPSLRDLSLGAVMEFASSVGEDGVARIESFCDLFSALVPTARAMLFPELLSPSAEVFLVSAPSYKYLRSDPRQCSAHGRYLQIAEVTLGHGRVVVRVPQPTPKAEQHAFKEALVAALYEVWEHDRPGDPPPNWAPASRSTFFLNFPGVWSVDLRMLMLAVEAAFESRAWTMTFKVSHLEFLSLNQKTMRLEELLPWWALTRNLYYDVRHVGRCFLTGGAGHASPRGTPAVVSVNGCSMPSFSELFDDATAATYAYNADSDGADLGYQVTRYLHGWSSCTELASGGATWSLRKEDRLDPSDYSPQLCVAKIYNPERSDVQALLYPWSQQGYPCSRNGWRALAEKIKSGVELFENAVNNTDGNARTRAVLGRLTSLAFEYSYSRVNPTRAFEQAGQLTR